MKPRTIKLNGPRNRWFIYIGFLGKWGDHLRIVRLNKRLRDVTGGWTLIKGPRPDSNQDTDPATESAETIHGIPVEKLPPDWQDGYHNRKDSDPAKRPTE